MFSTFIFCIDPNDICWSFAGAIESVTVMSGTGSVFPVPLTLTVAGFSYESFDGMSKLSLNVPVEDGEKRTVSVQLDDGLRVCPEQLLFRILKGAATGLLWAILPIVRFAFPSFVTVTV